MKENAEAMAEKLVRKMADVNFRAAEAVKFSTIGEAVCRLLQAGEQLSVDTLLQRLETDVASSSSTHGKGDPALDLTKLAAEAAIRHLHSCCSTATAP